jgi:adenosylcobinamide-GDP ribazoletransferase
MATPGGKLFDLTSDLRIGVLFCTRLPLPHPNPITGSDVARASWALPVAGALVGALGALVYWIAHRAGLPAALASALALVATMAATGCLHEDGLADMADGFGGGNDRARKLEIMRDSRIGTYGACALALSVILRWSALASTADVSSAAMALIVTHASARAPLPAFMRLVPSARSDGLAAEAGRPSWESVAAAGCLGFVTLGLGLGPMTAIVALFLLSSAAFFMGWLSVRQIGGQTGDVLGALEQVNEILILLTVVAAAKG